ncbi:MAG: hypothetical protein KKE93_00650 [Nanoarchaeota archaeon]|nr:hypothetical protein [Nanoarchaeota archaeon]
MDTISIFPLIVIGFGFLLMILSVILKDLTLSERIVKNTIFLMSIATILIFSSFFFSKIAQIIPVKGYYIIMFFLFGMVIILAIFILGISKSPKITLISWILIILSILMVLGSIGLLVPLE